jgi:hypothetical protein
MIHEAIEVLNRYSPIDIDEHTDEHGYADHPGGYGASTETLPAGATINPAGIGETTTAEYAYPGKPPTYASAGTTPATTPLAAAGPLTGTEGTARGTGPKRSSRSRRSGSTSVSVPLRAARPAYAATWLKSQSSRT